MGAAWWMARFAEAEQHPLALSLPSLSLSSDPYPFLFGSYSPLLFPHSFPLSFIFISLSFYFPPPFPLDATCTPGSPALLAP